ncbi:MAG: metal-binding protein [Hydrogenothermaceae bacterium]
MASGRAHDLVNLAAFGPIVYYLQPTEFVSFTVGYMVGTFLLSPDNDIYHSSVNKRWKILKFFWYPYTRLFSHRGISHIPFYGTLTKLVYLGAIFLISLFVLKFILINFGDKTFSGYLGLIDFDWYIITNPIVISFFVGLLIAEIIHIFTDIIYSTLKPKKRKKRR